MSLGGIITTVAGTGTASFAGNGGPATAAALNFPTAVAVDAGGSFYIADFSNGRVRKVSAGTISTLAGNGSFNTAGMERRRLVRFWISPRRSGRLRRQLLHC